MDAWRPDNLDDFIYDRVHGLLERVHNLANARGKKHSEMRETSISPSEP
jgi:hypothetical protein